MNLRKHAKTLTVILILMTTGLAGCLGGGETEDVEQKTINIAGSSTVFPVASAWGQAYSTANDDYTVTVAGGGSGAGASKVCSTDADSVNIGDMSRDWKDSEATVGADGYTYSCVNTDVTITQLVVAYDGLSVVMKKGGAADQCVTDMGGLSMAQLRWIFSDWSEEDLANHEEGGLDMSSTTPNNDDDGVRESGATCTIPRPAPTKKSNSGAPIPIREPTSTSVSRCSARSASLTLTPWQRVSIPLAGTKTLLTTTKSSTALPVTNTPLATLATLTTKKTPTNSRSRPSPTTTPTASRTLTTPLLPRPAPWQTAVMPRSLVRST